MRVTLEFTLPDDDQALQDAQAGPALRRALEEFREWLRSRRKYHDLSDQTAQGLVDLAWDHFHAVLSDNGVEV